MSAQLNEAPHALLPLEHINAVEVFTGRKLDDLLAQIRAEVTTLVPDVTTAAGRKEIASTAYKVARSKTAIDDAGKELVAGWKSQAAVVDASRKKARDTLDALRDEVRAPLVEWEAAEAAKEQALIAEATARREAEEAEKAADLARREAVVREAEERIAARDKAEADRIAAEQAAAAQAERDAAIRAEAIEQAKRDAAEAVQRAEQAAEQARLAVIEAAAKAEHDQAEAVRQAEARAAQQAADAEAARLAAIAKEAAATEAREANKRHCAGINSKAAAALVSAGMDIQAAKLAVTAIASGKVPAVSIAY